MYTDELCEKYPYAFAHDPYTGRLYLDGYGKPYSGDESLPAGWSKLFWQCMEDIRGYLEEAEQIDTFYLTEVKEKYNTMRLYHTDTTEEVDRIINKYQNASSFVCQGCGAPATMVTRGWLFSYCDDCFDQWYDRTDGDKIADVYRLNNNDILERVFKDR